MGKQKDICRDERSYWGNGNGGENYDNGINDGDWKSEMGELETIEENALCEGAQ